MRRVLRDLWELKWAILVVGGMMAWGFWRDGRTSQDEAQPWELREREGQWVVVTGHVAGVRKMPSGWVYFDFEEKWPNQAFTVRANLKHEWPELAEGAQWMSQHWWEGQRVTVYGTVELRGKGTKDRDGHQNPVITWDTPSQLVPYTREQQRIEDEGYAGEEVAVRGYGPANF